MRLFTALWLPEPSNAHLDAALRAVPQQVWRRERAGLRDFRFVPALDRHVTLCFHGEREPDELSQPLRAAFARVARDRTTGPRLRLAGAGVFRSVLWVGVSAATEADGETLSRLVRASGGDPERFVGHVTVAKWSRGRASAALPALLGDSAGPWWHADEAAVVESRTTRRGPLYRTVHRIATHRRDLGGPGEPGEP